MQPGIISHLLADLKNGVGPSRVFQNTVHLFDSNPQRFFAVNVLSDRSGHETILVNDLARAEQIGSVRKVVDVALSRLVIHRFRGGVREDQVARILTNQYRFFGRLSRLLILCELEQLASGRDSTCFEVNIHTGGQFR